MRPVATRLLTVAAFSASVAIAGIAQDAPATSITNDPRVGLKAGFRDAGRRRQGHGARGDDAEGGGVLRSEGARGQHLDAARQQRRAIG